MPTGKVRIEQIKKKIKKKIGLTLQLQSWWTKMKYVSSNFIGSTHLRCKIDFLCHWWTQKVVYSLVASPLVKHCFWCSFGERKVATGEYTTFSLHEWNKSRSFTSPLVEILLMMFIRWNENRSYTEIVIYYLLCVYCVNIKKIRHSGSLCSITRHTIHPWKILMFPPSYYAYKWVKAHETMNYKRVVLLL